MDQQAEVLIDSEDYQNLKGFQEKCKEQHRRRCEVQEQLAAVSKQHQFLKLKKQVLEQEKSTLRSELQELSKENASLKATITGITSKQQDHLTTFSVFQMRIKQLQDIDKNNKNAIKNYKEEILSLNSKVEQLRAEKSDMNNLVQSAQNKERRKEQERAQIAAREKELVTKIMRVEKENTSLQVQLTKQQQSNNTNSKLQDQNKGLRDHLAIILTNKQEYIRQYFKNVQQELLKNNEISKEKKIQKLISNEIQSFIAYLKSYKS